MENYFPNDGIKGYLILTENAFGRMAAMWKIFQKPINLQPAKVDDVVLAVCCLHNFVLAKCGPITYTADTDAYIYDGSWRREPRDGLISLQGRRRGNNSTQEAKNVQMAMMNWFNSAGAVTWQDRMIQMDNIANPDE